MIISAIKDMPYEERPREKMLKYGKEYLSNSELIAILIRTGCADKSAVSLASEIICGNDDGILDLCNLTVEELCSIKGVGKTKACQIIAGIELGKRVMRLSKPLKKITSPNDVYNLMIGDIKFLKKEKFFTILLDTKHQIINVENISIGSLNSSIVHPREVFNLAVKKSAAAIILVHNHPSGNPNPSQEDLLITERLVDSGKILGINVIDHIIIGNNEYYSFKENSNL